MNFDGFQPQTTPRFGSQVQSDDVTQLPLGIARSARNCAYRAQSVGQRDGTAIRLQFGPGNAIDGIGLLRYLAPDNSGQESIQITVSTQTDGNVWGASPFLQSSRTQLTTDAMIASSGLMRNVGLYCQHAQAYNKMLIARGDLITGVAQGLIVDGATLTCDPISDKPVGDTWLPNTNYRVGQIVSPTIPNNYLYYCVDGGTTASSEPIWPTVEGATVIDGSGVGNVTWKMIVIVCTSGLQPPPTPLQGATAAGTAVPAGATLFLVASWVNAYGESLANVVNPDGTIGNVVQFKNTTSAAVNLTIALPPIPQDIAALPSQYLPTSLNVYGYLVAGTPDSALYLDPTAYALVASGAPGADVTINSAPLGVQIPTTNGAFTTAAGNVSSGVRYMIVLYETRTGYITGFAAPAPIRCDISVDGRKMLVQNIPIGPYNCVARICAFTVAGQGSAGPYFYISEDDYEDPGLGQAKIKQTATKIPDNTTTSAYFDFDDSYLPGASEVTDYFDRIEVPPASDINYSKTMDRVAYAGCMGYPSALLISDLEDPEAIRVPGSVLQVSQTDGDRVVCQRDLGTTILVYKENSGHIITPNDGDPSDWGCEPEWTGSGPCGPRALAVAIGDGIKMHAYAHRTGGYVYTGGSSGPQHITMEHEGTPDNPGPWDRINWAYAYLITTVIDQKLRVIYFWIPIDGATQCNKRIAVNFYYGLDDPIIYVQRTGKEVPNINGRKSSIDDIPANVGLYVPQKTSVQA